MKKTYIYIVDGHEIEDTECWGKAWKEAQEMAQAAHAPIYRRIIKEEEDVYCNGGIFISTEYANPDKIHIF